MKQVIYKLMSAATAAMMVFTILTSCETDDNQGLVNSPDDPSEYIYIAQDLPIPKDIGSIGKMALYGDRVYFTAALHDSPSAENSFLSSFENNIYSINVDGTGLGVLAGYVPFMETPTGAGGGVRIDKLTVDGDGNIWVVEASEFYALDLPTGYDAERDEPWQEYTEPLDFRATVRKLDSTGAELLSIDVSELAVTERQELSVPHALAISAAAGKERICLGVADYQGQKVYVLDGTGEVLFQNSIGEYFDRFIQMPDGNVAYPGRDGNLNIIDTAKMSIGTAAHISVARGQVFTGNGEINALVSDNVDIYGFSLENDETVKLLNLLESGVTAVQIEHLAMTSEGSIVCMSATQSSRGISVLSKLLRSELPEKTVLTMSLSYSRPRLSDAIAEFNRTNLRFHIEAKVYGIEDKIVTELTAGKIPDILDISALRYFDYAQSGMLADIYPLIDADPDFSRSSFVQAALAGAEVNGGLYMLPQSFYINTMIGHPSVVGPDMGWNMEEFRAVIDENPNSDIPLGAEMSKTTFLWKTVLANLNNYIDLDAGVASFDTPDFVQFLEFTDSLPLEIDPDYWYGLQNGDNTVDVPEAAIPAGRQILMPTTIYDFHSIQIDGKYFNREVVFKGFPSENRNGHALILADGLSIMESSPNKDGAWEFLRTLIDKDWQLVSTEGNGFPINQEAFDERAAEALEIGGMREHYVGGEFHGYFGDSSIEKATQEEIDMVLALIDAAVGMGNGLLYDNLWDIVFESASDYFKGASTAEDTARIIQSRVSLWVSERT